VFFIIFIFGSVIIVWGSKTILIFFNRILFHGEVNLVGGAFGRLKFKIPNSFLKYREKIKLRKNGNFTQNWYSTKLILVFGVTLRQINMNPLNF